MTSTTLRSLTALVAVSLFLPAVSSATVIFSNFGPSFTYDTANANVIGNAFDGNNYAEGDTFTSPFTATFSSLDIALSCFAVCPDPFFVSLTQDSGQDSPGTAIETFTVDGLLLGMAGVNNPPSMLNSSLFPTLNAGTQYWITVRSNTNDSIGWNDNIQGDSSDQAISTDGGATYFSPSGLTPGAYQVNGNTIAAAPEPGTFMLFAAILPVLLLFRRRASPKLLEK